MLRLRSQQHPGTSALPVNEWLNAVLIALRQHPQGRYVRVEINIQGNKTLGVGPK